MAGLIKGKKSIQKELIKNRKKLEELNKTGVDPVEPFYSVALPDIEKSETGEWIFGGDLVEIDTLEAFNAYMSENEELYAIIKANYPSIISTIWRSAFAKMYGGETVASKMLHGMPVDLDSVVMASSFYEYSADEPTINYILTKVNNLNTKNNQTTIKPYRKANKEVMSLLNAGEPMGYFLPEITEKGVVVTPTKNKRLSARFFAVGDSEYSVEQVIDYLMANASARTFADPEEDLAETEALVNEILELSQVAYVAMMKGRTNEFRNAVEKMNVNCSYLYNPDFSVIEQKATRKKQVYLEDDGMTIPPVDFDDQSIAGDTDVNAADEMVDEKPQAVVPVLEKIIVEGETSSTTKLNREKGTITLILTNEGGLCYETSFEDDGKTLRATPAQAIEENQKQ